MLRLPLEILNAVSSISQVEPGAPYSTLRPCADSTQQQRTRAYSPTPAPPLGALLTKLGQGSRFPKISRSTQTCLKLLPPLFIKAAAARPCQHKNIYLAYLPHAYTQTLPVSAC